MTLDVILTPAEIDHLPERDLSQATCVVFDILRATSSIVTGLAHGVREVYPAATIEEALALKEQMPDALLGGERHGDRIPGFDVGNSPFEYLDLGGRRVITTTTNGTIALRACAGAAAVIAGALLNLEAVAQHVSTLSNDVLVVCAGTFRTPALEDIVAAGALVDLLRPAHRTDAAETAHAAYARDAGDLHAVLRRSRNGRALEAKGRIEEVAWCAQVSRWPVIGLVRGSCIVPSVLA